MRAIINPDDFGNESYQLIPLVIFMGCQAVVWRPSFYIIDKLYREGKIFYNSDDFLDMVRKKHIIVASREKWLAGKMSRQSVQEWNTSPWTNAKDDALASFARDDEMLHPRDRRIIIAPPACGLEWARIKIEENRSYLDEAKRLLKPEDPKDLLPPGIIRHAGFAKDEDTAAMIVLRDAYNFSRAISETHCDIPIEPHHKAAELAAISSRDSLITTQQDSWKPPQLDQIIDALFIIAEFGSNRMRNYNDFKDFLRSEDYQIVRQALDYLLYNRHSVHKIREELENHGLDIGWMDAIQPSRFSGFLAVASIACSLWTGLDPSFACVSGILCSLLGAPTKLAKKLNLECLDEKDELEWLSLLVYGQKTLKLNQLDDLRKRIRTLSDKDRKWTVLFTLACQVYQINQHLRLERPEKRAFKIGCTL